MKAKKQLMVRNSTAAKSVVRNFLTTASDGKNYNTQFYSLDAVISLGYRVNSKRAIEFRQWATRVLKEFSVKGFVLDRKRLENGAFLGEDYFEKLLEEIREIRLSERRFYQKITDIYATSVDYNVESGTTQEFFAKVQNKLHYAIHGQTSAEVIAKNYLSQAELESLGRMVNAYLDHAEDMASRKIPMTMEDWVSHLNDILKLNRRDILTHAGKITAKAAKFHAESEFEKYRIIQDRLFESDFDKLVASSGKLTPPNGGEHSKT